MSVRSPWTDTSESWTRWPVDLGCSYLYPAARLLFLHASLHRADIVPPPDLICLPVKGRFYLLLITVSRPDARTFYWIMTFCYARCHYNILSFIIVCVPYNCSPQPLFPRSSNASAVLIAGLGVTWPRRTKDCVSILYDNDNISIAKLPNNKESWVLFCFVVWFVVGFFFLPYFFFFLYIYIGMPPHLWNVLNATHHKLIQYTTVPR